MTDDEKTCISIAAVSRHQLQSTNERIRSSLRRSPTGSRVSRSDAGDGGAVYDEILADSCRITAEIYARSRALGNLSPPAIWLYRCGLVALWSGTCAQLHGPDGVKYIVYNSQ